MFKWISVRITPQQYDDVRQLAVEENRSINGTVREAIERYVRARKGRQPKTGEDR